MTFLNPFVLIGLIAAGVPILIHLLQLKKLRRVDLSSVRFLKEIQHASARRVKLRDYLLLILRTLAIAALVLAFSRPAVKGFLGSNSKSSSVIIVDNSPSTTARNEYGEIASQIRKVSANLLNNLHAGNDAGVILTSAAGDTGGLVSSLDPRTLSSRITRSGPSNVSRTYAAAIYEALAKLRNSGFVNREIYLIGDMQKSEFADAAASDVPHDTRIFFVKTEESPNDNLSVSGVKLVNPVVEVNSPSQVQATIENNDGSEKSGIVAALYIDGKKVAQSVTNISAGSSQAVRLAFSVGSSGFHQGIVRIEDNSIQSDNKFYFSFYAIQRLRVLIVSSVQGSDYVLRAAQAVMDTSTVIDTKVVTPDMFLNTDLTDVDVVAVESYPKRTSGTSLGFDARLTRFVNGGGGAILFAPREDGVGSFVSLTAGMKMGTVTRLIAGPGTGFITLEHIDAAGEFFSGIFTSRESASQIRNQLVTKIFRSVKIVADPFAHVLMSTSVGPFLLSREVGGGFAFVVACGADTASSNFPLSPFFPVVIQRALFYSAAVSHRPIEIYAGDVAEYRYAGGGIRSAMLVSPSGSRSEIVPGFVGSTARFELGGLDQIGTYTLVAGDTLCEISVNVNPRESDLSQESDSGIKAFAHRIGFAENDVYIVDAGRNTVSVIDRLRRGEDLSSFFAGAALLFLIAEIFVSRMKTI